MFLAVIICTLMLTLVAASISMLTKSRTVKHWGIAVALLGAIFYYVWLLTSGSLRTFFANDPYSGIYPNLLQHAMGGDFGIDPQYAFREYFIGNEGMPTVYFGFMPVFIRALAWIFNDNIYSYSLGNLSIVFAMALAMGALVYSLHQLKLFQGKTKYYSHLLIGALVFASPIAYLGVWGRIHNEVISWGVAWGIIFVSFYGLWLFTSEAGRKAWWATVMGVSVGMCVLSRPTIALTIAIPFAYLVFHALLVLVRRRKANELKMLFPGIACALALVCFAMFINYQRWGNPLTFVKMDRHIELLKENPRRGSDLREAGEFNPNRLSSSAFYYLVPNADNISKNWPYIEIDHSLSSFTDVPQYDYIEGSRVPISLSALFLIVFASYGVIRIRTLWAAEMYASFALLAGGIATLLSLFSVYAVALRYSVDIMPAVLFCVMLALVVIARQPKAKPLWWEATVFGVFLLSIYLTTITCLQYKVISGQIDLPSDFKRRLAQSIHFFPKKEAKLFIINGDPAPIRYW